MTSFVPLFLTGIFIEKEKVAAYGREFLPFD